MPIQCSFWILLQHRCKYVVTTEFPLSSLSCNSKKDEIDNDSLFHMGIRNILSDIKIDYSILLMIFVPLFLCSVKFSDFSKNMFVLAAIVLRRHTNAMTIQLLPSI